MLLDKHKIKVTPIKIKAYQDKSKVLSELTLLEKINCKYDSRAKLLIMNEERKIVPFPFILQSPFLANNSIILNTIEDIRENITIV